MWTRVWKADLLVPRGFMGTIGWIPVEGSRHLEYFSMKVLAVAEDDVDPNIESVDDSLHRPRCKW